LTQNVFSESEIFHLSSSDLRQGCKDTFCRFLEHPSQVIRSDVIHGSPTRHALEFVDQPFQMKGMQLEVLAWDKDEPYFTYCSPIQHWIGEGCGLTCQYCHEVGVSIHPHELEDMLCKVAIFISVHDHFIFDIDFFWFINKHKGKTYDVSKELAWLDWKYDFT
jgi:hypothetical protein